MRRNRRGVTLVELLAVLAVLGVAAGVTGFAFHAARAERPEADVALDRVAAARREAITTGRSVSTTVVLGDRRLAVTAHADGRVLADSLPTLDPLSGRPRTPEAGDASR